MAGFTFPPGDNLVAGTGAGALPLPSLDGDEQIIADRFESAVLNYTTPDQIRDWTAESVSVKQIKAALVAVSSASLYSVANAVNADIASTVNIIWTSGGRTYIDDDLYDLIKLTLSYSTAQMLVLYTAASALPE